MASCLLAEDHPKGAHQTAIPVFLGRRIFHRLDLHFGVGVAPLSPRFANRIGSPFQGDAQHASPLLPSAPGGFMDLLYRKEGLPRALQAIELQNLQAEAPRLQTTRMPKGRGLYA